MATEIPVSVIVPVYNAAAYLKECLESILASTLPDVEIIAVDDGSTDESPAILDRYASERGVKVLHRSNAGPAAARNAGLHAASGKYVGFVDSDDWIEPDMYEKMFRAAEEHDSDIVFCNIYRNESEKMPEYLPSGVYRAEDIRRAIYPRLISCVDERKGVLPLRGSVWCRLFRRQLLQEHRIEFPDGIDNNEDGFFTLRATLAASTYVYLGKEYLYHNRVHSGSLTRRYIPRMWERQQALIAMMKEAVSGNSYDFAPQIAKKIFEIACYSLLFDNMNSPLSRQERRERARMIVGSPELRNALKNISWRKLKKINKLTYWAFRCRFYALAVYLICRRNARRDGKGGR